MDPKRENEDILAEVRSINTFFEYLTRLFSDSITGKSRRMLRDEFTPLIRQE